MFSLKVWAIYGDFSWDFLESHATNFGKFVSSNIFLLAVITMM